jgi:hypothetical protein
MEGGMDGGISLEETIMPAEMPKLPVVNPRNGGFINGKKL